MTTSLLDVAGLKTWFPARRGLGLAKQYVHAVDDVSFALAPGEVLALVGESGSGKTTVGRSVLRLVEPTAGSVRFKGDDVLALRGSALRAFRRHAQIVFQDPYSSLSPRMKVEHILTEPMRVHGIMPNRQARRAKVTEILELVGLAPDHMHHYPHEFSGGQRQRVAIARALMLDPDFIVADEPVSALDVSVQAQIVNLLRRLQSQLGLSILFIAHDLAVVEYIADRIAVMYLGKIMEIGPTAKIIEEPQHPYTHTLLAAVPNPDPDAKRERKVFPGEIPSPLNPPSGCVFRTRCPFAVEACAGEIPPLRSVGAAHEKACIRDDLFPRPTAETTTKKIGTQS